MKDSVLVQRSREFAIKIIQMCDKIKGNGALSSQLLRSGTSIGANIHEALFAQGTNDFISKLHIALKECSETEYWLFLLKEAEVCDVDPEIIDRCVELKKMLIASIKTSKKQ